MAQKNNRANEMVFVPNTQMRKKTQIKTMEKMVVRVFVSYKLYLCVRVYKCVFSGVFNIACKWPFNRCCRLKSNIRTHKHEHEYTKIVVYIRVRVHFHVHAHALAHGDAIFHSCVSASAFFSGSHSFH